MTENGKRMTEPRKPPNLSLQRKSSARIAAVQCLYQIGLLELKNIDKAIADVKYQLADAEPDDEELLPEVVPHWGLMEKIVRGVMEHQDALDTKIIALLPDRNHRLSTLMRAILEAALFEMSATPHKANVFIDEYVTLTGAFFDDGEKGFVNAILDAAARGQHSGK